MPNASVRDVLETLRAPEQHRSVRRRETIALVVSVVLTLGIAALDAMTPLGVSAAMLYTAVVLAALWLPSISPYAVAGVTAALTLAGLLSANTVAPTWVVLFNRGMDVVLQFGSAAVVAVYHKQQRDRDALLKRVEESLSEVRMLEGLLPICAWCKRIRDAEGHWEKLESYVTAHSQADFSHGACPDCAERVLREAGLRSREP